jgi:hypothetical protein
MFSHNTTGGILPYFQCPNCGWSAQANHPASRSVPESKPQTTQSPCCDPETMFGDWDKGFDVQPPDSPETE